ncbi:MAG: hypothetical protein ACE14P_02250 [Methanotrichaceae archaeon]
MLKAGTIDAWAYPDIVGVWLASKAGLNASEYEIIYQLDEGTPLYYAFNKNTSNSTVNALQAALVQTKKGKEASGVSDFETVLYKYLPVLYGKSNLTPHQVMDIVNRTSGDIEKSASSTFANISAGARGYKDNADIALFVVDTKAIVMAHSSRPELVGA